MTVPADFGRSLVAAIVLGGFSAAADWVWGRFLEDGAVLPGVVHGVLIFALLALVLGWAAGSRRATRRLLLSLPVAGLLLAAAFYPLAVVLGYLGSLLATWIGMWLALAILQRWARGDRAALSASLVRGLLAAIGSGLAFWAVSGMWTDPAFAGGLGLRLLYWTLAFLPGFMALLMGQERSAAADETHSA